MFEGHGILKVMDTNIHSKNFKNFILHILVHKSTIFRKTFFFSNRSIYIPATLIFKSFKIYNISLSLKISMVPTPSSSSLGELQNEETGSLNFGYLFALLSPFIFTAYSILTKQLVLRKVHYSIVSV